MILCSVLPVAALAAVALSGAAFAHAAHGGAGGLVSGFTHPDLGLHHAVAMVAVGLLVALLLDVPAICLLPAVLPVVMAVAVALGGLGLPIALAAWPPAWVAGLVAGSFPLFHAHAHDGELPVTLDPFAHALGFVLSTGLLHGADILRGVLAAPPHERRAVPCGGGAISRAGSGFLAGRS